MCPLRGVKVVWRQLLFVWQLLLVRLLWRLVKSLRQKVEEAVKVAVVVVRGVGLPWRQRRTLRLRSGSF
jgi:nitric oxide reductase large subunit